MDPPQNSSFVHRPPFAAAGPAGCTSCCRGSDCARLAGPRYRWPLAVRHGTPSQRDVTVHSDDQPQLGTVPWCLCYVSCPLGSRPAPVAGYAQCRGHQHTCHAAAQCRTAGQRRAPSVCPAVDGQSAHFGGHLAVPRTLWAARGQLVHHLSGIWSSYSGCECRLRAAVGVETRHGGWCDSHADCSDILCCPQHPLCCTGGVGWCPAPPIAPPLPAAVPHVGHPSGVDHVASRDPVPAGEHRAGDCHLLVPLRPQHHLAIHRRHLVGPPPVGGSRRTRPSHPPLHFTARSHSHLVPRRPGGTLPLLFRCIAPLSFSPVSLVSVCGAVSYTSTLHG
eukprot:Sspe_Gene.70786::Locus_41828_Transcript_1_1_Confidence_1.000_Length_1540::g.70786::m.70786